MSCKNCKEKAFFFSTDSFKGVVLVKSKRIIKSSEVLKNMLGKTLSQLDVYGKGFTGYKLVKTSHPKHLNRLTEELNHD